MKSATKIMLFLFFSFLLAGCAEKPSSVVEKFAMAYFAGNFEEAKKYATKNVVTLIDDSQRELNFMGDEDILQDMKFVLIKEKIDGDNAVVVCKISSKEITEEKWTIYLIKEEGKWKVTFPE